MVFMLADIQVNLPERPHLSIFFISNMMSYASELYPTRTLLPQIWAWMDAHSLMDLFITISREYVLTFWPPHIRQCSPFSSPTEKSLKRLTKYSCTCSFAHISDGLKLSLMDLTTLSSSLAACVRCTAEPWVACKFQFLFDNSLQSVLWTTPLALCFVCPGLIVFVRQKLT